MHSVDRRSALTLFVAASGLALPGIAAAGAYNPDFGQAIAPGVREVHLGSAVSTLSGYKAVSLRDWVFQPGANTYVPAVPNDMICHVTEGLLRLRLGGREWIAKRDLGLWTSPVGAGASYRNTGKDVAVMRIMDLLSA